MGTQPIHHTTNLQTMCPIFEYGSLSTITTSDTIISKIQRLQNKFIRLALRLPKYISVKLLHDSSGLPYVKDRLFSRATRTLERISANPLVEESISSNKVNPAWDRFPTPPSIIRPVRITPLNTHVPECRSPVPTGNFGTVFGLNYPIKTTV